MLIQGLQYTAIFNNHDVPPFASNVIHGAVDHLAADLSSRGVVLSPGAGPDAIHISATNGTGKDEQSSTAARPLPLSELPADPPFPSPSPSRLC